MDKLLYGVAYYDEYMPYDPPCGGRKDDEGGEYQCCADC